MGLDLEALFEPGVARRENMNIKTNTTPFQFSRPHTQSLSLTHSTPFNHSTPPPPFNLLPLPPSITHPLPQSLPLPQSELRGWREGPGGGGARSCLRESERARDALREDEMFVGWSRLDSGRRRG